MKAPQNNVHMNEHLRLRGINNPRSCKDYFDQHLQVQSLGAMMLKIRGQYDFCISGK